MPLFPLKIRRIFFPIRIWKILFLISLTFYLLPFSLSFLFLSCEKSTAPLNNPQVFLTAEYVGVTEADILMKIKNIEENTQYRLYRNDSMINSGTFVQTETIFTDTSLLPAHNYIYKAQLIRNEQLVANSQPLVITTMDTTSHNYMWTIDTIGGIGSFLYDVFAISENDVWAVGDIDTGAYPTFNAMHWDGQQWELKRIPFIGSCSAVDYPPIRAVWVFSDNHILFTNGGAVAKYDGMNTQLDCGMNDLLDGAITKIFAFNPSNIYAVGVMGTVVYFNGNSWQRMDSGTQLRLTDIWGLSENDIYTVGADMSSLDNVVLHYDGTSWNHLPTDQNRKVGVWGTPPDNLYFVGDGVYHYDGENYHLIDWPAGIPHIFSRAVRGNMPNNIFVAGDFGMVLHFNGSSWKGYTELLNLSGTALKSVSIIDNSVFVVGSTDYKGIIFHGKRID
jgi:hypothetical protein